MKGCTSCTRACPRFRNWETEADGFLFGRARLPEEQAGIARSSLLARATDPELLAAGQDGGVVSAILIWCLEHDRIDAALVSLLEGDGSGWRAVPGVAQTRDEVLAAAGSSVHVLGQPLGLRRGRLRWGRAVGSRRDGVPDVSSGCHEVSQGWQGRPPPDALHRPDVLQDLRRLGYSRSSSRPSTAWLAAISPRSTSKAFSRFWCRDGSYHEVPLKEGHAWTREGCKSCPDFAAEHADISTGGIGEMKEWTLTDRPHRTRPGDH